MPSWGASLDCYIEWERWTTVLASSLRVWPCAMVGRRGGDAVRSLLALVLWWFLALNGQPVFPPEVVPPFTSEEDCAEVMTWLNDEVWRQNGRPELFVGPYQCLEVGDDN